MTISAAVAPILPPVATGGSNVFVTTTEVVNSANMSQTKSKDDSESSNVLTDDSSAYDLSSDSYSSIDGAENYDMHYDNEDEDLMFF